MRAAILTVLILLCPFVAHADDKPTVVSACGTVPAGVWVPGGQAPQTVDTNGNVCTNGSGGGTGSSVEIAPGTGSNAAVAPANTPATAANPAVVVAVRPGDGPLAVTLPVSPTLAAGSGVVPTQGGAALSVTNPSFTEITDGTHAAAATKAASTAAVATDPALVVALSPNSSVPAGTAAIGGTQLSPTLATLGSVLTRPANTTAYAGTSTTPQLVGSSTTAGSVTVPSFSIATSGGYAAIPRLTLSTNVTTGWGAVALLVNLWVAAPTYTNGDGGTYAVATGAASWRAQYSCTLTQNGDGANCSAAPTIGNAPVLHPASGALLYWDVEIASAATPISGQTFTLVPEIWN
jgi:hypothetical protein